MRRRAASQRRFCRRKGGLSPPAVTLARRALVEIKDGRRAAATPLCVILTPHADTRAPSVRPLALAHRRAAHARRSVYFRPHPRPRRTHSRCRRTRRVLASDSHCLTVGWSPFPTLSKPSTLLPRWIPQPIRLGGLQPTMQVQLGGISADKALVLRPPTCPRIEAIVEKRKKLSRCLGVPGIDTQNCYNGSKLIPFKCIRFPRDQITPVENENVYRYTSSRHANKVSRSYTPQLDRQRTPPFALDRQNRQC